MTTFAAVNSDANVFVAFVQSSDAADLQSRVNAAIAAVAATARLITAITLAGAGDGHTYVVEVESALPANIIGTGALAPANVSARCYMAANAFELALQRSRITATGLPLGDEQIAGGSKGTRFMAMFLVGTAFSASSQADGAITNFPTTEQTAPFLLSNIATYPAFTLVSDAGFVPGADNSPDFVHAAGVFTYNGGVKRFPISAHLSGTESDTGNGLIFLSIAINGALAHGVPGFARDSFESATQDQLSARAYRQLAPGNTIQLAVAAAVADNDLTVTQASLRIG